MSSKTVETILIIAVIAVTAFLVYKYFNRDLTPFNPNWTPIGPPHPMEPIVVKEDYEVAEYLSDPYDEDIDIEGFHFGDAMNYGKRTLPVAMKAGKVVAPHIPAATRIGAQFIRGTMEARRECGRDPRCWMSKVQPLVGPALIAGKQAVDRAAIAQRECGRDKMCWLNKMLHPPVVENYEYEESPFFNSADWENPNAAEAFGY